MMKWKALTETTCIGVLELGNLTFDEAYMEVAIDICDMSDNLKADVDKAIEVAKVECIKEWNTFYNEHPDAKRRNRVWSSEPVIMDFTYLRVILEEGKPIQYSICAGFHDRLNDLMEGDCKIRVDLSQYQNELKKAIIKVLVDKFF